MRRLRPIIQARAPDEGPSGDGPSAATVGGQRGTEDMVIEERHDPKLLRAVSQKYKIESTRSLVAAYNATTDKDELAVLRRWLNKYGERSVECLRPMTVLEYAELANIKSRSTHDDDTLRNLMNALCSCICQENFREPNFAIAFRRALESVDPSVYGGVAQLVVVAQSLLSSLSSELRVTKENFDEHEATFLALRQILLLLSETNQSVYEKEKFELRFAVVERKIAMELSCKYYPVSFNFNTLRQAMERIETKDAYSNFTRAMKHVGYGLCLILHVINSFNKFMITGINPQPVRDRYTEARVGIASMVVSKKPWFDTLKNLIISRQEASKDEMKLERFEANYSAAMEHQRNITSGEDLKALRFGIIRELSLLALEGLSKNTQNVAMAKLVDLATHQAITEEWTRDIDILFALLDVTCELHGIGQCNEDTKNVLRVLYQSCESFAEKALTEWLGGSSMEDKLQVRSQRGDIVQHEHLCIKIGRNVGYIPLAIIAANKEDLRRTYLQDDFAMVASLFAERPRKHVKDMKHHVVISEEIVEESEIESADGPEGIILRVEEWEGESSDRIRDQAKECYEKKTRVTKPIALDDLFRRRSLDPEDPESEVRRVLIYGNPGSGKTCLTKVVAHRWALGEMAQDFKAVYVVPVRVLNSAESTKQRWTRLEEAISQICFSERRHTLEFHDLITQIGDELDDPSTLLMVDGLDEANDNTRELVSTIWRSSCKVLFLSRPYNTGNIETRVDIQVECLGFNDQQLRGYIRSELSEDAARRLIAYLYYSAALWEMAHIPVTAYVLCCLTKEHRTSVEEEGKNVNIFQVYNDMEYYIWKRFKKRSTARNPRKPELLKDLEKIAFESLLKDLEKIAFESLRKGLILIHERFVREHAMSKNAARTFKESGLLLFVSERQEYQFPHFTFQEYFAGRYIARSLKQKGSSEEMEAIDFIHGVKYDEKYALMLTFTMHEIVKGRSKLALKELLSIIDEQSGEVLEMKHVFLRMRALEATIAETYEAKDLETLVRDEQAIELAEGARRLLETTFDNVPVRQIVVAKFEQCYCVLDKFPQILENTVEELKRLLTSTRDSSKDDDAKTKHALILAKQSPRHIKDVIQFFLKEMSRVQDQCSSYESLRRFGLVAKVAPHYAGDMLLTLGRWRADGNSGMRERAMEILKNVIRETPNSASSTLPMLKRAFSDKNVIMRMEATKAIESVVEAAPHLAGDMVPILEKACTDEESGIRRISIKAIESVVEAAPYLAGDMVPILEKACTDENSGVRRMSIKAIGSVVEAAPHLADDMLAILKTRCTDKMISVRERVMETIGNLVKAAPHLAGDMLTMLKSGAIEKDVVVRMKATKAIGSVVGAASHLATDTLPVLESAYTDEKPYVRRLSIEVIENVVDAAPHLAAVVLPMLEKACADENAYVRERVMETIGNVGVTAKHIVSDVLPMLERGCRDEIIYVRERALKAIRNAVDDATTLQGSVGQTTARLAANLQSMQEGDAGDKDADACVKADEILHFPPADKFIHSTIALLPDYKKGLLFLLVRYPFLSMMFTGSEDIFFFLHGVSSEDIEKLERESFY